MLLAAILVECILLWLVSRRLTVALFALFFRLSHSSSFALSALTLLLFPGTVTHELSHLFVAEILGVPTGTLTLVPESIRKSESKEQDIRTGSVAIAKTDPFRRTIIGIAPLFTGLAALAGISYYLQQFNNITIVTIFLFYLLFAFSNTMFSSREDLKGVIPFLLTIFFFAAAAYVAGVRFSLTGKTLELIQQTISSLSHSLLLVLAVNGVLLLTLKVLLALARKMR